MWITSGYGNILLCVIHFRIWWHSSIRFCSHSCSWWATLSSKRCWRCIWQQNHLVYLSNISSISTTEIFFCGPRGPQSTDSRLHDSKLAHQVHRDKDRNTGSFSRYNFLVRLVNYLRVSNLIGSLVTVRRH